MCPRKFREQGKVKTRRFGRRRDAHQAVDPQAKFLGHPDQEGRKLGGRDPGLLRFFTRIDLDQQTRRTPGRCHRLAQGRGQPITIKRLDHVEQLNSLKRLIALQGSDQAQFQIRMAGAAFAPMVHRFLNPVFAEHALTRGERCIEQGAGLAL